MKSDSMSGMGAADCPETIGDWRTDQGRRETYRERRKALNRIDQREKEPPILELYI